MRVEVIEAGEGGVDVLFGLGVKLESEDATNTKLPNYRAFIEVGSLQVV